MIDPNALRGTADLQNLKLAAKKRKIAMANYREGIQRFEKLSN